MTRPMRVGLFVALVAAWIGTTTHVVGPGGIPHARGVATLVDLAWVRSPVGFGLLSLVYVAGSAAAAARARPLTGAVVAFLAMALVAQVDGGLYTDVGNHHGKLLPISVLLASSMALRARGELAAREAACGVIAAAYAMAGLIKLWQSGPLWFLAANLPLLAAERAIGASWPFAAARMGLAETPWLGTAGGLAVLTIELGGVCFLWPRARRWWAVAMIASHVSIGVFLGYLYPDWILVLIAMGLLHPRSDAPASTASGGV